MIGPSILSCCFEVDEDVKDLFVETFENLKVMENIKLGNKKDGKQKYFIDTMGINYKEMLSLGLQKEHICLSSICTKCNKDWMHSYRGDPIENGRNIAFICLKGD